MFAVLNTPQLTGVTFTCTPNHWTAAQHSVHREVPHQLVEFQRAMGLVPDGIAGSMTLIQMNNALQTATPKLLGST